LSQATFEKQVMKKKMFQVKVVWFKGGQIMQNQFLKNQWYMFRSGASLITGGVFQ